MDKIIIDRLEVFAYHGVLEHEKREGQTFFVSATLHLDLAAAGRSDDLAMTVNYAEVCGEIVCIMQTSRHDLIETCAEELAGHILHTFPLVGQVDLRIDKPSAPIDHEFGTIAVEITRKWSVAYLGLGSNMGQREENIARATEILQNNDVRLRTLSPNYTTKPVSDIPQDDYINAAAKIETTLSPAQLMAYLLEVEAAVGRTRNGERWGPRVIDIDLLMYENVISDDPRVTLPHPRMHERSFVLCPLCNIAPNAVHPLLGRRVWELKISETENKKA
ncbi:MAG: 2-amino-4-hydroxy-6-hydroxymethyldihydropteridine diphosphokinase [Oscillospiraceae bacterium]|nr:2-amino-4-hydroxy-6-hydroxymethyldihydropteridine diphosphokinase [Oscillospiraceae bacterium]